nr:reverse transcriptase domain-containing protein [Tanacetum cinerariifolium]
MRREEKETSNGFLVEIPSEDSEKKEKPKEVPNSSSKWRLYIDGASNSDRSGAGLMLIDLEDEEYTYALCFEFETTNNEAEYEALLAGTFATKKASIKEYLQKVKTALRGFEDYTFEHARRNQNMKADALSKLASMTFEHLTKEVLVKVLTKREVAKAIQDCEECKEESTIRKARISGAIAGKSIESNQGKGKQGSSFDRKGILPKQVAKIPQCKKQSPYVICFDYQKWCSKLSVHTRDDVNLSTLPMKKIDSEEELHVTWAHLEKKQTRLQTYTNISQDYVLGSWRQRHSFYVTLSQRISRRRHKNLRRRQRSRPNPLSKIFSFTMGLRNQLLSVSLLICLGKHDCIERIPSGPCNSIHTTLLVRCLNGILNRRQNPIRTLGDYSKPNHEGYKNTIKLPVGNNVVPLRFDTIRIHHHMGESDNLISWLILSTGKDRKTSQGYPDVPTTSRRISIRSMDSFQGLTPKKTPRPICLWGRGFLATANAIIDCKMAKIAAEEGITRSIFSVKGVDLGEEEAPYWTTLGKRESYKLRPVSDGVGTQTLYYPRKDFLYCHLPREWETAKVAELNSLKDTSVFKRMVEFLGAIPINLKYNMWESEDLILTTLTSSPNHPTSNIEDAFSSMNTPDYTPASPGYFLASPGNTSSDSSNNLSGLVPIASPTLLLFHDDLYMKVMHAYDVIIPPLTPITPSAVLTPSLMLPSSFSVYTPTPPQIFEIGKSSIKMHLKHHEKQIEDILNYLEELSFHRIEKIEERLVNGWMIIQIDFDKLKTELEKFRSQISGLQKKHIGQNDKIAFARFRIFTIEITLKDIQPRHQLYMENLLRHTS